LPLATSVGQRGAFLGTEVGPFSETKVWATAHGNAIAIVRAGCNGWNEDWYTVAGRAANEHGESAWLNEDADVSRLERGLFVVWSVWVIAATSVVVGVHSAQEETRVEADVWNSDDRTVGHGMQ
jgi:hypothetical protein